MLPCVREQVVQVLHGNTCLRSCYAACGLPQTHGRLISGSKPLSSVPRTRTRSLQVEKGGACKGWQGLAAAAAAKMLLQVFGIVLDDFA